MIWAESPLVTDTKLVPAAITALPSPREVAVLPTAVDWAPIEVVILSI